MEQEHRQNRPWENDEAAFRAAIRNRVGSELQKERESQGLSQRELGRRAGISGNTVLNIENGKFSVSIDLLTRLALTLGIKFTIG